ncbi:MAG: SRPBCC family protein [Actinomycetota bacterium]
MQIENEFSVAAPADRLWSYLLDVERIAPCMPGAELTETVDERTWKGKVNMKLGPVSLSFAGTVAIEERDDDAHRVVLRARGMESKGKGAANAAVTSWLEPSEETTTVKMVADIQLTGAVAQLSRGLLPEVSRKLTQQFADCLQESMLGAGEPSLEVGASEPGASDPSASTSSPPSAPTARAPTSVKAKPIGGLSLGLAAIWAAIANLFRRLFGSRRT